MFSLLYISGLKLQLGLGLGLRLDLYYPLNCDRNLRHELWEYKDENSRHL